MNILVTGGAGYIGSHTVRALLERDHNAIVLDNLSYGHAEAVPAKRLVLGDLNDAAMVERLLAEQQIEAVVHFAAFAYVGESVKDPAKYYSNNLINSLSLLDACRKTGVGFVFPAPARTAHQQSAIDESEKHCPSTRTATRSSPSSGPSPTTLPRIRSASARCVTSMPPGRTRTAALAKITTPRRT